MEKNKYCLAKAMLSNAENVIGKTSFLIFVLFRSTKIFGRAFRCGAGGGLTGLARLTFLQITCFPKMEEQHKDKPID